MPYKYNNYNCCCTTILHAPPISLHTAGPKSEAGEADASLLVTLELNNTVYQGVLFAKPNSGSVSSPSSR